MFIVEDLSKKSESGVYSLNDYTDKINRAIFDIKKNYFYIGGLLNEINGTDKYKELGYSSIVDYCESTFGFKKTFTYDLMKVQKKFNDGTIFNIADRFKNYDFSKLVLMSSMNDFQLAKCKSDMTVQELKDIKKNRYHSACAENLKSTDNNSTLSDSSKSVLDFVCALEGKSDSHSVRAEKYEIELVFDRRSVEFLVEFLEYCKDDFLEEIKYAKSNLLDYSELTIKLKECKELLYFLNLNLESEDKEI
ncbi:MAG: hypothetical protein ACI4IR_04375 [Eubacterium sp.]